MKNVQIKNYDVLIVRLLLVFSPFILSYVVSFILVLLIDGYSISPLEFITHIFDAKPIAVFIIWSIIISTSIFLIKKNKKVRVKDSITMTKWMQIKTWALSLGESVESK